MSLFKLEKPDLTKSLGIKALELFNLLEQSEEIRNLLFKINHPKYLYWDKVKYLHHPNNISAEGIWFLTKHLRKYTPDRSDTIIRNEKGSYFSWLHLPTFTESLHEIDMELGGNLAINQTIDDKDRHRFIMRGIMEEAIASSQLEGASTTRKAGKQLILQKRKPRNLSEQMILNNYNTILLLENDYKDSLLDLSILFDLHLSITKGTIDKDEIGRLRRNSDKVNVVDSQSNLIYHIPPDEKFLESEIRRLIDYANDELNDSRFVHPVIKAIFLHFWIGYLHPFTDGNGRLARAIFYWYLIRHGYWAFAYTSLSTVIKRSPARYRDAYVYSEQDDYDLTYFMDYNIRKIRQAKKEFKEYVNRKSTENKEMISKARAQFGLNDRQISLMQYYAKNKGESTTIKLHTNIHQITRITAIKDLRGLEKLGFLTSRKIGREVHFYATEKILELS